MITFKLGTMYVASETLLLQSFYKWWCWVDLDLFYGNGPLDIWMGKAEIKHFSVAITVCDTEKQQLQTLWRLKVKVV